MTKTRERGFIINPYVYGAGGGGSPTDPFFADVILLIDASAHAPVSPTDPFWSDVILLIDGSR